MKRITCILLAVILAAATVSCGTAVKTSAEKTATAERSSEALPGSSTSSSVTSPAGSTTAPVNVEGSTVKTDDGSGEEGQEELLQSASVDLDSDGTSEQVFAIQKTIKSKTTDEPDELEGILRISGKDGTKDVVFVKKQAGLTGVMNSFVFKDLDGDGVKDIFIIIPDVGASFSLNYFFIYNYRTGKSYTYNSDTNLSDFAGGFTFNYKGKGLLQMNNGKLKFHATFNISDGSNAPAPDDEGNIDYESSWVDPTPVEINIGSYDSKIALASKGQKPEIMVPLPLFGRAANDMIGEIDIYYSVNSSFEPVMKRFVVKDFKDSEAKVIGEEKVN